MAGELENRRPLASRSWPVMGSLSRAMVRAGVTPNQISVAGLVFAAIAGAAMVAWGQNDALWARVLLPLWAVVFMQLRLVCNLIDGMVAIEGGKRSAVGVLYNEVPDRFADAAILIGAGFAPGSSVRVGLAAALVAVLTAYIREVGHAAGTGCDYGGPMAKQQRMAMMTAACVLLAAMPWLQAWAGTGVWARWMTIGDAERVGVMGLVLMVVVVGGLLTCVLRLKRTARKLKEGVAA